MSKLCPTYTWTELLETNPRLNSECMVLAFNQVLNCILDILGEVRSSRPGGNLKEGMQRRDQWQPAVMRGAVERYGSVPGPQPELDQGYDGLLMPEYGGSALPAAQPGSGCQCTTVRPAGG